MSVTELTYFSEENATTVVTSSTSFVTAHSTTGELVSGRKYLIMCHALIGGNDSNVVFSWRLITGSVTLNERHCEPANRKTEQSYGYCTIYTATDGDPITLQQLTTDASTSAKVYWSNITAIDITDWVEGYDYFHATNSVSSTHTTTHADRATYTLDPTSQQRDGKWAVIAQSSCGINNGGVSVHTRIKADNVIVGGVLADELLPESIREGEDTSEQTSSWFMRVYEVDSSISTTPAVFTIQTKDSGSNASQNEHVSSELIGLRAGLFVYAEDYWSEDAVTSTSGSWVTGASGTLPVLIGSEMSIVVGSAIYDGDSTNRYCMTDFTYNTTDTSIFDSARTTSLSTRLYDSRDENSLMFLGKGIIHTEWKMLFDKDTSADVGISQASFIMFRTQITDGEVKVWNKSSGTGTAFTASDWLPTGVPATNDIVHLTADKLQFLTTGGNLACKSFRVTKDFTESVGNQLESASIVCDKCYINRTLGSLYMDGTIARMFVYNANGSEMLVTSTITDLYIYGSMTPLNFTGSTITNIWMTPERSCSATTSKISGKALVKARSKLTATSLLSSFGEITVTGGVVNATVEDLDLVVSRGSVEFNGSTADNIRIYEGTVTFNKNTNSTIQVDGVIHAYGGLLSLRTDTGVKPTIADEVKYLGGRVVFSNGEVITET